LSLTASKISDNLDSMIFFKCSREILATILSSLFSLDLNFILEFNFDSFH
jgi:hypothetical protein